MARMCVRRRNENHMSHHGGDAEIGEDGHVVGRAELAVAAFVAVREAAEVHRALEGDELAGYDLRPRV